MTIISTAFKQIIYVLIYVILSSRTKELLKKKTFFLILNKRQDKLHFSLNQQLGSFLWKERNLNPLKSIC